MRVKLLFLALLYSLPPLTAVAQNTSLTIQSSKSNYRPASCDSEKGLNFDSNRLKKRFGVDAVNISLKSGRIEDGERIEFTGRFYGHTCDNLNLGKDEFVWRLHNVFHKSLFVSIRRGSTTTTAKIKEDGTFLAQLTAASFFTRSELDKIKNGEPVDNIKFEITFGAKIDTFSFEGLFLDDLQWTRQYTVKATRAVDGVAHFLEYKTNN